MPNIIDMGLWNSTYDMTEFSSTAGNVFIFGNGTSDYSRTNNKGLFFEGGITSDATCVKAGCLGSARRINFALASYIIDINVPLLYLQTAGGVVCATLGKNTDRTLSLTLNGGSVVNGTHTYSSTYPGVFTVITVAYSITSASVHSWKVYVNGVLDITLTNSCTLVETAPTDLKFINPTTGLTTTTTAQIIDDLYIDDGSDLSYPGDIYIIAKRPYSNNVNQFDTTTSISNSSYGSGFAPYVNQRVPSTSGARRHNAAGSTADEYYTLEADWQGDYSIANKDIVGRLHWVIGTGISTDKIIYEDVGGTLGLSSNGAGASSILRSVAVTTASIANAVTGVSRTVASATNVVIYECGMAVAFKNPSPGTTYTDPLPSPSGLFDHESKLDALFDDAGFA